MLGFVRGVGLRAAVPAAMCISGCVITTTADTSGTGDSTGSSTSATGMPSSGTSATGMPSGTTGDTAGTSATDGTTGSTNGLPDDCGGNLLADPGFEAGTPNPSWAETSDIFGSPICDLGCTEDSGAAPHAGMWWVWFGGLEEPDNASVSQTVPIGPDAAYLTFFFEINAAQGDIGDDLVVAEIDGETVFMATDAEVDAYAAYTEVVVDVSQFADGQPHTLTFRAELTGEGLTNFFVDDVSLVSCTTGGSTGSSGTETSGSTGTSTGTGTDTDTDTDAATTG
jgi:hypothetical protein